MRLNYDVATDSLYIHLSDTVATDSDEVSDGVVLDFAADGSLVGIDVQHASLKAVVLEEGESARIKTGSNAQALMRFAGSVAAFERIDGVEYQRKVRAECQYASREAS